MPGRCCPVGHHLRHIVHGQTTEKKKKCLQGFRYSTPPRIDDYTASVFQEVMTHVVHGTGEVEAQVGRSEADNGQLADAPVLKLRLSQEVEGDEVRKPDGVESDVA